MATEVAGNADILTEILLRLPVKALMRFKCVSKQWHTLISNPRFCRSHTLRLYHNTPHPFPSALLLAPLDSHTPPSLIIPSTTSNTVPYTQLITEFEFLNVPFMELTIKQSCNGLLLVKQDLPTTTTVRYFVCNLITKQFDALNLPSPKEPGYKQFQLSLAFDPLRSPHYKVILIRYKGLLSSRREFLRHAYPYNHNFCNGVEYEIDVYCSETRCWSDFQVCLRGGKECRITSSGIYCNGAIYWNNNANKLLCYDVENQWFKTVPMPSNIENHEVGYFGESGGYLHMILKSRDNSPLLFDILELEEDCSVWSVRFHVDLREQFQEIQESFYVICIFRQEKEEESVLVFFIGGMVISYNLLDYTCRRLSGFNPLLGPYVYDTKRVQIYRGLQYFENLSWHEDSPAY